MKMIKLIWSQANCRSKTTWSYQQSSRYEMLLNTCWRGIVRFDLCSLWQLDQ